MPTEYPHITRDENGVLRVDDTGYKVILIITAYLAWGGDDHLLFETYSELTKAQLHAVLAYYYDHQSEIDSAIESTKREVERQRSESYDPSLRDRLRREMHRHEASSAPT